MTTIPSPLVAIGLSTLLAACSSPAADPRGAAPRPTSTAETPRPVSPSGLAAPRNTPGIAPVEPVPSPTGGGGTVAPEHPESASGVRLRLTWQEIVTSPGCFFFSGPGALGRDTPLGDDATYEHVGSTAALVLPNARFDGTQSGNDVHLTRRGAYAYGGGWVTRESLDGAWEPARRVEHEVTRAEPMILRAVYTYRECEGREGCTGGCTIRAVMIGVPIGGP